MCLFIARYFAGKKRYRVIQEIYIERNMEETQIINLLRNWGLGWEFCLILTLMVVATIFVILGYKSSKSRNLLNALPGAYTSLGLLGTFMSIVIALNGIDINKFKLDTIINGLVPAFTTSIAGLVFALVATLIIKYIYGKEDFQYEKQHTDPNDLLQDCAISLQSMKNNTEVLPSAMSHINAKLQDQQVAQAAFNEKLDSILDEFKKQEENNTELKEQLNENMAKQTEALQSFITNFVNRMDEIFKQMQTSINQQVQTFGTEQFEKTSKVLEEITKQMSEVSNSLMLNQVQLMTDMAQDTTTKLESFNTEQMEKIQNLLNNQVAQAAQMQTLHSEWADRTAEMQRQQYDSIATHNAESLQQMVMLKEAYAETSKQMMDDSQEKSKEMCDFVRTSMLDMVSEIDNKVRTQCETLNEAIGKCVGMLQESYEFIDSKIAQIKSDYEQATQAYSDAVQNAHDINDSFEKTIVHVDSSIQSLAKTNEGVDKVLSILEERQTNIDLLVQKIHEMSAAIVVLQQLEIQLNKLSSK